MVAFAGIVGVLTGPVLAAWSRALAAGVDSWWRPSWTGWPRVLSAMALAGVLAGVGAAVGTPAVAWIIWGLAGAVLIVVDVEKYLLPRKLIWPASAAIASVLSITAIATDAWSDLLRAAVAAVAVGAVWLLVMLAAPAQFGLGDVRLLAVGAGLLGWNSWTAVLSGQVLALLAAAVFGLVMVKVSGQRMVPLGPGIVVGMVAAAALV